MINQYFSILQLDRFDYIYDVYIGKESLKYQLRVTRGATEDSNTFRRRVVIDAKPHKNWPKFLSLVCNI